MTPFEFWPLTWSALVFMALVRSPRFHAFGTILATGILAAFIVAATLRIS